MTGPDNAFSLLGGLVRPASRGSVTLTGSDEDSEVAVDLGALEERADVDALVASVSHCRSIGRHAALGEWGATEIWPGPGAPTTTWRTTSEIPWSRTTTRSEPVRWVPAWTPWSLRVTYP